MVRTASRRRSEPMIPAMAPLADRWCGSAGHTMVRTSRKATPPSRALDGQHAHAPENQKAASAPAVPGFPPPGSSLHASPCLVGGGMPAESSRHAGCRNGGPTGAAPAARCGRSGPRPRHEVRDQVPRSPLVSACVAVRLGRLPSTRQEGSRPGGTVPLPPRAPAATREGANPFRPRLIRRTAAHESPVRAAGGRTDRVQQAFISHRVKQPFMETPRRDGLHGSRECVWVLDTSGGRREMSQPFSATAGGQGQWARRPPGTAWW